MICSITRGLSDLIATKVDNPFPISSSYDCIVLGLGAMGSACLYQLAKRGASVLGLEQFNIPHALGSSGGISRQTKVAPYLGSRYEALILRANENWRTLEKDSKQNIFQQCGHLKLEINQKSVGTEWTNIEIVDGADLHHRFPQFQNLPDGINGLLDHQGGFLQSEMAIAANCYVALSRGAHIRTQTMVTGWETNTDGVKVTTEHGFYKAKHLVISVGPWSTQLVPSLDHKLQVTRLSFGWFSSEFPAEFVVNKFPTWEHGSFYGFPSAQSFPGIKIAKHWTGHPATPDQVDRKPNLIDEKMLRNYLQNHLPWVNNRTALSFKVCMYTHGGPFLDFLPDEKRVTFISACNGGGFKFSSAYGEALADLATKGETDLPIQFMTLD